VRDETLTAVNIQLVAAQSRIQLARTWGGGDVASADGKRFVVPVRTIHAEPNPKYFNRGRGVTWYNLLSDQGTGLNAVTVPGTLRDSLVLLSVVLEQQTELQPTHIMTDTGAYSDVVFGLFRLLGYRFSPRLADIGGTRFWRLDAKADYGELNSLAQQRVNLDRITPYWDDVLRLTGSLKLGRGPARGIMRTLQVDDQPTLDRETKTRLRDIGEARVILGDVISGVDSKEDSSARTASPLRKWTPWAVAALALAVAAISGWSRFQRGPRLTVVLSTDGRRIVFSGRSPGGGRQLFTRRLDQSAATPLAGTARSSSASPFRQRLSSKRIGAGAEGVEKSISILNTSASVCETLLPSNRRLPVSISDSTTPYDQISARLSTGKPSVCSGLM
jgi:hypothetical protein